MFSIEDLVVKTSALPPNGNVKKQSLTL